MRPGHSAKFCQNRLTCNICKRRHATSLHGDLPKKQYSGNGSDKNRQSETNTVPSQSGVSLMSDSNSHNDGKCSMIVPVWVSHDSDPNCETLVYALLDTQSDTTFVSNNTCYELGVKGPRVQLKLSTMTSEEELVDSHKIKGLSVRSFDSEVKISLPTSYSRNSMPANLTHVPTPEKATRWPHLAAIADKLMSYRDIEVGLLIGYNCPKALAPQEVILPTHDNEPYGARTQLGWSIVGIVNPDCKNNDDPIGVSHRIVTKHVLECREVAHSGTVHFSVSTTVKEAILPHQLVKFMEIDFNEPVTDQTASYNDRKFLKQLEDGVHKSDKHYEMPLPFREETFRLPNNKALALTRLRQLQRKFSKDSKYKEDYVTFMQNIIECGHAEKVPDDELTLKDGKTWYIPHHGVYNSKKPDKIRVVFDCSARYEGVSLNDCLLKGPDLTNDLVGVLCRFRQDSVAVVCDIEQMFHQFKVNKEDRNYLRFLWFQDGKYGNDIIEYRMCVHLFGAASSPGCANFGLKKLLTTARLKLGVMLPTSCVVISMWTTV